MVEPAALRPLSHFPEECGVKHISRRDLLLPPTPAGRDACPFGAHEAQATTHRDLTTHHWVNKDSVQLGVMPPQRAPAHLPLGGRAQWQ